jgi:hypothetical protein
MSKQTQILMFMMSEQVMAAMDLALSLQATKL